MSDLFQKIRIVLVETQHPGNIGSAARALKTMGFSKLVLVKPENYPARTAFDLASHAEDILASAQVVNTLSEALVGCEWVVGTSARNRYLDWPMDSPRGVAEKISNYLQSHHSEVAIVFGRERNGLTNEELRACHLHLHIDANPEYPSLNLAAAVQIVCYELRLALCQPASMLEPASKLAPAEEMEALYIHLESALRSIDFIKPRAPKQVMNRLKRLFQRARCEPMEVRILRGMCNKILKNVPPQSGSRSE